MGIVRGWFPISHSWCQQLSTNVQVTGAARGESLSPTLKYQCSSHGCCEGWISISHTKVPMFQVTSAVRGESLSPTLKYQCSSHECCEGWIPISRGESLSPTLKYQCSSHGCCEGWIPISHTKVPMFKSWALWGVVKPTLQYQCWSHGHCKRRFPISLSWEQTPYPLAIEAVTCTRHPDDWHWTFSVQLKHFWG